MKKFFKFFAVALVASTVLFSCGKDPVNPDNNDSTGNNPGGNTDNPAVAEGKILVNFGGSEWTSVVAAGVQSVSYGVTGMSAYSDAQGQEFPMADCFINAVATGEYSDNYNVAAGGLGAWTNETFNYIEYYKEGSVVDSQNTQYGDYWALNATVALTQLDATALTFSMNCNATMFKAMDVFGEGGVGIDGADKQQLKMTANKVAFQLQ